jgi:hypothetical protein
MCYISVLQFEQVCMLYSVLFLNNTVSSIYTVIWYIYIPMVVLQIPKEEFSFTIMNWLDFWAEEGSARSFWPGRDPQVAVPQTENCVPWRLYVTRTSPGLKKKFFFAYVDILSLFNCLHTSRLRYVAVVSSTCLCIKVFQYEDKPTVAYHHVRLYYIILYYEC